MADFDWNTVLSDAIGRVVSVYSHLISHTFPCYSSSLSILSIQVPNIFGCSKRRRVTCSPLPKGQN